MKRIWEEGKDFTNGCKREHWIGSFIDLPVITRMYSINVVWFDVSQEKTHAAHGLHVRRNSKMVSEVYFVNKKGYVNPDNM